MINSLRIIALVAVAARCAPDSGGGTVLHLAGEVNAADRWHERRILSAFASEHPGLRVVRGRPEAAGDAPDLVSVTAENFAAVRHQTPLLDLRPFLPRVGLDLGGYDSSALAPFRRGDAVYAVPRGYSPVVLAFNRRLFDRADAAYPTTDWTWEDFAAAARELTQDTDDNGILDQWGTLWDARPAVWLSWIQTGGGEVLCAGKEPPRASGCLDAPLTIAALRWYASWMAQVIAPSPSPEDDAAKLDMFLKGHVAMLAVDHSTLPALRAAQGKAVDIGIVTLPHKEGFAARAVLRVSAYAVPARAWRRKLAVELLAALVGPEGEQVAESSGYEIPALHSAAQELAAGDAQGWERALLDAATHAAPSSGWGTGAADQILTRMMRQLADSPATAEAAVRRAAQQLDRVLSQPQ
jgi:ABC-type glycerol-3-phosphate transport system substrate-binding protein